MIRTISLILIFIFVLILVFRFGNIWIEKNKSTKRRRKMCSSHRGKWEPIRKRKLISGKYRLLGRYVKQKRICQFCGKKQIRTKDTLYDPYQHYYLKPKNQAVWMNDPWENL